MADPRPFPTLRLLGCAALVVAAGCNSTTSYRGRDSSSFFPTARLRFDVTRKVDAEKDPIHAADQNWRWVGEADASTVSGDIGNRGFDLTEVTVGARLHRDHLGSWDIDGLGGVAGADINFDPGSAGSVQIDSQNLGPYLGVEVGYRSSSIFRVYARAQNSWLINDATSARGEVGAEFKVYGPINALFGYRWWRYVLDKGDIISSSSDAEINLRGIFAGISIDL